MYCHCCTYHLPIVGVVTTGVPESPSVEVWQSGHGALEVVLLHPGVGVPTTGDDDGVLELDGACIPVIITIMTPSLTLMTLYSLCPVFQSEAGCGAGVGGRQYLRPCFRATVRPSSHQHGRLYCIFHSIKGSNRYGTCR